MDGLSPVTCHSTPLLFHGLHGVCTEKLVQVISSGTAQLYEYNIIPRKFTVQIQ